MSNEKAVAIPEARTTKEIYLLIMTQNTISTHDGLSLIERIAALQAEVDALKAKRTEWAGIAGTNAGEIELLKAEVARLSAPVTEELYEDGRCQVCGWPLSKSVADGCVPESCSMRPREGSEDWFRLKERRAWLAARATPPQDVENGGKQ